VTIKVEESEPSTSKVPYRKPSISDHDYIEQQQNLRPKRVSRKRRYTSDSDYSIDTTASSYNSTKQKNHKKKRGRPAKEVMTVLPTLDDFKELPIERASHLVLRIKNNEASRRSRQKSKNMQDKLEEECTHLEKRQSFLKFKKQKLDADIETLRRWLLGH
jgi:Basic region leucine zipper